MATIPSNVKLNATTVDILNTIRNNASINYQNLIPKISGDSKSEISGQIRTIGKTLMTYEPLKNEFLNALYNRIGRVIITSKSYENPWRLFKGGILDYGETIEEVFVNLVEGHNFDPGKAESEVFKREIPDVRSAFHTMNFQKFYKVTVSNQQLNQAFLSVDGVQELISHIIDSLTRSMNYDEFQVMQYTLALNILNGKMFVEDVPDYNTDIKACVSRIKAISNDFEYEKKKYNLAGVYNHAPKTEQVLIVSNDFDSKMSVELLAWVFNLDYADITFQRVGVDSFGDIDMERLRNLFKDEPNFVDISEDELKALDVIPCVLVSKDWFKIYDNLLEYGEIQNIQGLYFNHFVHTWKTFSSSPFENNALFVVGTPTVNSVSVSPAEATVYPGNNFPLSVTVDTDNFAPKTVEYSTDKAGISVSADGVVIIPADTTETGVTITVTSTYDSSKTDTCILTINH